jgi:hypothetical protein
MDQSQASSIVQPPGLHLPLLVQGQLLPQKQDCGAQGCARGNQQTEETKSVAC